jgi:UDP-2-acetamido-2-deoxy-ribo-hexuluronate aminotransferase
MSTPDIRMVDLQRQYQRLQPAIDKAIESVLTSTAFIKGPQVSQFENNLATYLGGTNVISCGNGTDALQLALMALDLPAGSEVIVPSFTFVASAEVIALLGLIPVFADCDSETFNLTAEIVEPLITPRTRAIIPVHLFGQCVDMEPLMALASIHNLWVIEDACQAIGAEYTLADGTVKKAGTVGHIGCTSFFPSKNLGCFGDGGALFTSDPVLAKRIRAMANHGMEQRYHHHSIGINSRLDTIQAAILDVKLAQLDDFNARRQAVATAYNRAFESVAALQTPVQHAYSTHVFHQYTLKVEISHRDALRAALTERGIPTMVYYPVPLHKQAAYVSYAHNLLPVSDLLSHVVLSLPMHTEMTESEISFITDAVCSYFGAL